MDTHGIYEFKIRGYECGEDAQATLATICNLLQEAAGLNAGELGISKLDFNAGGEDISWILTRMRVKIRRYPKWWEKVRILTYPRSGRKIVVYRDFELFIGEESIGCATSEWMLMNLVTRKLVAVPQKVYEIANTERAPVMGEGAFSKLHWVGGEGEKVTSRFQARRGDVDINGHVNNVRYIEWIVEVLPADAKIEDIEIVYKSETRAGDEVIAEAVAESDGKFIAHTADSAGHDHAIVSVLVRRGEAS